ncbi:MAG: MarR family transcriptional regulator [Bacillota bacterium]|nr:MarR family transcriptional regulator [Bacillota bacterium]MDW7682767.1 MarR family transcriptional regulator [Bacillota bacterium]
MIKWKFASKLKEYNLTPAQWGLIKDISVQEEKQVADLQNFTPAMIAQRLYLDRPTVSGVIDRAVKNGWVERLNNPEDRRSQIIRLTGQSRSLIGELNCLGNEIMEYSVTGLSAQEINMLKMFLTKMIHNLSEDPEGVHG